MQSIETENLPHNPKVLKARARLIMGSHAFLGAVVADMNMIRVPEGHPHNPMNTMATDGRDIIYCNEFVDALPLAELVAVLAHEGLHRFFKHHVRCGTRDHMLWNIATDFAINGILRKNNFQFPKGEYEALDDPKYDGMSAEEIYEKLMAEIKKGKKGNGQGKGDKDGKGQGQKWGQVNQAKNPDGTQMSTADADKESRAVDQEIRRAWAFAKQQGNRPGYLEKWFEDFNASRVDYRDILPRYITGGSAPVDFSMRRFNRRQYAVNGIIMPTTIDLHAGCVVMAIDTSGSVSDEELKQFLGEVAALHQQFKPECLMVVQCDSDVSQVDIFGPEDEVVAVKVKGRGGTSFIPPFEWLAKEGITPDALVYLTDLACDSYPPIPTFPVLWVSSRPGNIPFGEVAYISVDPTE